MAPVLRKVILSSNTVFYLEDGSNKFVRNNGTHEATKLHGDTSQKTLMLKFEDVGI